MNSELRIAPVDPLSADAQQMLDALSETLAGITGSSGRASFDASEMALPGACFVLARDALGHPAGCGAFRPLQAGVAELKRMYAHRPRQGIGQALLAELESRARLAGYREMWLETRAVNTAAVRFYEGQGFRRIDNYGRYVGRAEALCFAKPLQKEVSHG